MKFGVYPNAYYNYKKQKQKDRLAQKEYILKRIKELYHKSSGRPGYRMMTAMLANEGITLSSTTVHKYMNTELKLKSVTRKKKYVYHNGEDAFKVFDNILNQDFISTRRNAKWCIDFTYLYLSNGAKRYNCSIIDLYDRRIVASVNGRKINTALAKETVFKALQSNENVADLVLHSDRGSQFTSKEFVEFCKENSITQSMSKAGCPYDNAPMERYFNTLKAELINLYSFSTEEELFNAVTVYAYGWYNNLRPHSHNNNMPPAKVA